MIEIAIAYYDMQYGCTIVYPESIVINEPLETALYKSEVI